jgi:hypothetical protein
MALAASIQQVSEVRFGIETVEFAGADQAVDRGGAADAKYVGPESREDSASDVRRLECTQ